ncbi:hypothetical protein D3C76_1757070 [compost metagenome]
MQHQQYHQQVLLPQRVPVIKKRMMVDKRLLVQASQLLLPLLIKVLPKTVTPHRFQPIKLKRFKKV